MFKVSLMTDTRRTHTALVTEHEDGRKVLMVRPREKGEWSHHQMELAQRHFELIYKNFKDEGEQQKLFFTIPGSPSVMAWSLSEIESFRARPTPEISISGYEQHDLEAVYETNGRDTQILY